MIELVWRCPYCSAARVIRVGSMLRRNSLRFQVRSRLAQHFRTCPAYPDLRERSTRADQLVAELLA